MRARSFSLLAGALLLILTSCSPIAPSILGPKGPAARSISNLGWLFIILGGIIFLIVMAYLVYALVRVQPNQRRPGAGTRVVIIWGMIVPGIILLVLFVLNTNVLRETTTPLEEDADLVIEVVGNQWWWQVIYPEQEIVTANEIHIPAGQKILLKLTSDDVIHSFWVPELHGKMDLIPGRTNTFWIQADQPGRFLGECAEYCGTQHAKMQLWVVADAQEDFDSWVANMQQPAAEPDGGSVQQGQEVFQGSNCGQCHTVRGAGAGGETGPDLTHLASRQTIGAGILPLTRANLGGWVSDPHGVKPGVHMPASSLTGEELQLLLDYLLSLE